MRRWVWKAAIHYSKKTINEIFSSEIIGIIKRTYVHQNVPMNLSVRSKHNTLRDVLFCRL